MKELYEYVLNFFIENEVSCPESIYQCDRIREQQEEFMCNCFELVVRDLSTDEEGDEEDA